MSSGDGTGVLATVRNAKTFSDTGQPQKPARTRGAGAAPGFSCVGFAFLLVLLAFQQDPNSAMGGGVPSLKVGGPSFNCCLVVVEKQNK